MRVGVLIRDRSVAMLGGFNFVVFDDAAETPFQRIQDRVLLPFESLIGSKVIDCATLVFEVNGGAAPDETRGRALQQAPYLRLLTSHRADREASWAARVLSGQNLPHPNEFGEYQMGYGVEFPATALFYRWLGGLLLLSECGVFALIGGFIALRLYARRFDFAAPLPLSTLVVGGSVAAFVVAACLLLLASQQHDEVLLALLRPLLLGGVTLPLLGLMPATRVMVKSYLLHILCLLSLVGLLLWQVGGMVGLIALQNAYSKVVDSDSWPAYLSVAAPVVLIVLAVPSAVALLLALVSRARRVPVAAGVARGFHRFTLPLLTILLLAFVALTFSTARFELLIVHNMERCAGIK